MFRIIEIMSNAAQVASVMCVCIRRIYATFINDLANQADDISDDIKQCLDELNITYDDEHKQWGFSIVETSIMNLKTAMDCVSMMVRTPTTRLSERYAISCFMETLYSMDMHTDTKAYIITLSFKRGTEPYDGLVSHFSNVLIWLRHSIYDKIKYVFTDETAKYLTNVSKVVKESDMAPIYEIIEYMDTFTIYEDKSIKRSPKRAIKKMQLTRLFDAIDSFNYSYSAADDIDPNIWVRVITASAIIQSDLPDDEKIKYLLTISN